VKRRYSFGIALVGVQNAIASSIRFIISLPLGLVSILIGLFKNRWEVPTTTHNTLSFQRRHPKLCKK
jgi:hypothetical protein